MPALFLSRVASSSHRTSSRASKCPKNQSHQLPPFRIWDTSAFSSMKCITLSRLFIERKFYDFPFVRMINVMTLLLEVRGLTVELPTAAGWVRPVNEVSLRIAAGESLGLVCEKFDGAERAGVARRAWRRNRHGLSGAHDLAESRDAHRRANRRNDSRASTKA